MKILLTLAAGVAVVAVAGFTGSVSQAAQDHVYAMGVTNQDPGCTEEPPPFCLPFAYTYRVLAVEHGTGHAWGFVSRLNHGNGVVRTGDVTCMTSANGRAAIGGIETSPSGLPFLLYLDDRGPPEAGANDRISAYAIFPPDDPDLPRLPPDFPRTCPSPDPIYGSFAQASGDVTVVAD
jgi:hypothetical protein